MSESSASTPHPVNGTRPRGAAVPLWAILAAILLGQALVVVIGWRFIERVSG